MPAASSLALLCVASFLLIAVSAQCPFAGRQRGHPRFVHPSRLPHAYDQAKAKAVNYDSVVADLKTLMVTNQDFWPMDYGSYGPFFIRLAWHCTGSYRVSDGRGGCDGGRQRFDPERSWADNTNLDKARHLLQAIKIKYGDGLSWGDLIVLAGTTAIQSMGGPVLGFCAGRIDDEDGTASIPLGPSDLQNSLAPCPVNGNCTSPLGPTTIGLIYVNPEGPMGVPDPIGSAPQVRDTFGRMAMNDSETVALIGGGHAFGKTHGACPSGPGPSPAENPSNPWPGTCGSGPDMGKGANAFTSGFEGSWTTEPNKWSNEFFTNLLGYKWNVTMSPGGHHQWTPVDPKAPKITMLTSDISLLNDPSFLTIVNQYANDQTAFENAFAHAWYKLTTRDMGPLSRCLPGPSSMPLPPAQNFQYPLPPTPSVLADFSWVRGLVTSALTANSSVLTPDLINGTSYYGALFANLAWQCASTYRHTDHLGGCNGARIAFAPQANWPANAGTDKAIQMLNQIQQSYSSAGGNGALSLSDLIVFAGQTAIEQSLGQALDFCPGRTDASEGSGSEFLAPRSYNESDAITTILEVRDQAVVMGLSSAEMVVLQARLRSPSQQIRIGYSGSWNSDPSLLSNAYFTTLLSNTWTPQTAPNGRVEFVDASGKLFMLPSDLALIQDPEYLAHSQRYAADATLFVDDFKAAWTKLVTADRFDGPAGNACSGSQGMMFAL